MEQHRIGGSGVSLSAIGLGAFELGYEEGEQPDVDRARTVLQACLDEGVGWLDTSENYLETRNESLVGMALRGFSGQLTVCTKVAPSAAITGGGSGFRPQQIRSACLGSLRRLGVEIIDVYLLHWPDETGVPLEDTWGAMAALVDEGLVRAVGMSNYEIAEIELCHRQRAVDVVQTGLSMIDYLGDRDLIRRCGELGIAVTIYEPLASGILTGRTREQVLESWTGPWRESSFFKRLLSPGKIDRSFAVADGLAPIARRLNATIAQVAIAWVLDQSGVTSALAGSRDGRHMSENAGATELDIAEVRPELDALLQLGPAWA